jgi:hypothetical protein
MANDKKSGSSVGGGEHRQLERRSGKDRRAVVRYEPDTPDRRARTIGAGRRRGFPGDSPGGGRR